MYIRGPGNAISQIEKQINKQAAGQDPEGVHQGSVLHLDWVPWGESDSNHQSFPKEILSCHLHGRSEVWVEISHTDGATGGEEGLLTEGMPCPKVR